MPWGTCRGQYLLSVSLVLVTVTMPVTLSWQALDKTKGDSKKGGDVMQTERASSTATLISPTV